MEGFIVGSPLTASVIPIENIYYLFCYAWNRFEEAQRIPVTGSDGPDLPNLLSKVLLNGTRAMLRRGLDRGYQPHEEDIATVRGRIELGATMQMQARRERRLRCEFDELSHDLLHNRILKASLKRLARAPSLDRSLAHDLQSLARRLSDVSDIWLERSAFARVQLHRSNASYAFLLKVAKLAFDSLLPAQNGSGFVFHDVMRDERKMARVFEDFVRNFYRAEQTMFAVESLTIRWDAERVSGSAGRLPNMVVDIYLRGGDKRVIIDTKYYAQALQVNYGSESIHSGNLYQLFSYLKNAAGTDPSFSSVEGMLLYPYTGSPLDERFEIQNHKVRVATVDLTTPWRTIEKRLLSLIGVQG